VTIATRGLRAADLPAVLATDRLSFPAPVWSADDYRAALWRTDVVGWAALSGDRCVGHVVYRASRRVVRVLALAVHPHHRRQGAGTALLLRAAFRAAATNRRAVVARVRETNLPALSFFRSCGFEAVGLDREFYADTREDGVRLRFAVATVPATKA
jgi:ribosomal-protein-alanine N-acetyltransferase